MLSLVDFGLHVAVAIYMQVHFFGDHNLFWAFICLALAANMFALVGYVARNVEAKYDDADGAPIPSDLQARAPRCRPPAAATPSPPSAPSRPPPIACRPPSPAPMPQLKFKQRPEECVIGPPQLRAPMPSLLAECWCPTRH